MRRNFLLLLALLAPLAHAADTTVTFGQCQAAMPTSVTTTTCTDANMAATPVGGIVFLNKPTSNDSSTGTPFRSAVGFFGTTGGATEASVAIDATDLNPDAQHSNNDSNQAFMFVNSSSTKVKLANVSAVAAGQVTINQTTATDTSAALVNVVMFAGVEARVVPCVFTAGTTCSVAHGLSGAPEVIYGLSNHQNADTAGGQGNQFLLGSYIPATGTYAALGQHWVNNTSPADLVQTSSTTNWPNVPVASSFTVTTVDGTNVGLTSGASISQVVYVFAIRAAAGNAISAKNGSFTTPTGTGSTQKIASLTFLPKFLMTINTKHTSIGNINTDAAGSFSFGAAIHNGTAYVQGVTSLVADDGAVTSNNDGQTSFSKIVNTLAIGGASDVEATVTTFDGVGTSGTAGGVTFDFTNINASALETPYLVMAQPDTKPAAITFTDKTAQALSSTISSADITPSGYDGPTTVTVSGDTGCASSVGGGAYSSSSKTLNPGQTLSVQVTSSSASATAKTCTATIDGTVADTFSATTDDFVPNAIPFVDQTNVALNTVTTSAGVTIAGLGAAAAASYTVSGTGCTGAINGGAYSTTPGTVINTDVITMRVTSSPLQATQLDCVASVGSVPTTDTWSVTTTSVAGVAVTIPRLLADIYAGSNDDPITGHAPDNGITDGEDDVAGNGWVLDDVYAGTTHTTATIQSNKLSIPNATVVITDVGSANHVVDVDWTPTTSGDNFAYIILRYSNSANYWRVGFNVSTTNLCANLSAVCNYISIGKIVGGTGTGYAAMDRNTTPALPALTTGTTYRIMAGANGNNLFGAILVSGTWYVVKATDASLNTVTKAGLGNSGNGGCCTAQIFDNINIMQSFASTDATTLRKAADPEGFFAGLTIPVGTFHWMAPRTQIDQVPVDLQFYCCGSWYIDPTAAYVGPTVWGIERYNPVTASINATTHTHTTLETSTPTAPTLSSIPDQTCSLNTDPGPLNISGLYLSNPLAVYPVPTWTFTTGATGLVMTSGRTLNTATGIITGLCTSASGSPVTTTVCAENATGTACDTFTQTVTTLTDAVPDPFGWISQSDVAPSTAIDSEARTITGYDTAPAITISNGEYSINAGAFTSAAGSLAVGDTVTVRVTSSGSSGGVATATVTIGGVTGTFSVTTAVSTPSGTDTIPQQFALIDAAGVSISSTITSGQITVLEINAASTIGISGGEYEKNNSGTWTSAIGTVVLNDKVRVRGTSAATANAAVNVVLSIGGVIDTFTITTAIGASCSNIPNQRVSEGGTVRVDFNGYCTGVTSFSGTAVGGLEFDQGVLSGTPLVGHWVQHFTADGPQGSFPVGVTIDVTDSSGSGRSVIRRAIRR